MRWLLRAVVLIALVTAGAGVFLWLRPAPPRAGTSFLLITVDSMRADHLGAYGYPRSTTPRIDRLAREGIVFEKAFSQAPLTKPSVASLLTSTYSSVHRVMHRSQYRGNLGETVRLEGPNGEIVAELTSRLEEWTMENLFAHLELRRHQ